jgi:hypothetical protein
MVVDATDSASVWMNGHYGLYWVPTNYFDGGYNVFVGLSGGSVATFRQIIESAGAREVVPLNLEVSVVWLGSATMSIHVELSQVSANEAPLDPGAPTGSDLAVTDMGYSFSSVTSDPNEDQLYYMWDFGDEVTDWLGPYASGEEVNMPHTWTTPGIYDVRVKAKDDQEAESQWSMPLGVDVKLCGDTDPSGGVDIDDAVYVITYVFGSGPAPVPLEVGNVDCLESVDIDDAVYLVMYIFAFGPVPCAQCN